MINEYTFKASVLYLPRTHFDHSSLFLTFVSSSQITPKPFRIESIWCNHSDFPLLVAQSFPIGANLTRATMDFADIANSWNKNIFVNIFHNKKHLLARLEVSNNPLTILLVPFSIT